MRISRIACTTSRRYSIEVTFRPLFHLWKVGSWKWFSETSNKLGGFREGRNFCSWTRSEPFHATHPSPLNMTPEFLFPDNDLQCCPSKHPEDHPALPSPSHDPYSYKSIRNSLCGECFWRKGRIRGTFQYLPEFTPSSEEWESRAYSRFLVDHFRIPLLEFDFWGICPKSSSSKFRHAETRTKFTRIFCFYFHLNFVVWIFTSLSTIPSDPPRSWTLSNWLEWWLQQFLLTATLCLLIAWNPPSNFSSFFVVFINHNWT